MADVKIILYTTDSLSIIERDIISLNFTSEMYSSSTFMKASLITQNIYSSDIKKAELYINNTLVHCGKVDKIEFFTKLNVKGINITSHSFTELLNENFLTPGLYNNISFNNLIDNYVSIPNIYHEYIDTTLNYIYIAEKSSLWNVICKWCYRYNGGSPYVTNSRRVAATIPENPSLLVTTSANVISMGTVTDTESLFSSIYMSDTDGNYDTYSLSDTTASNFDIVRRKEIALDMEFLYNPQSALEYRLYTSKRKLKRKYIEVNGYYNADINWKLNYNNGEISALIKRIEIRGNSNGIKTKYFVDA